ncbi:MAG: MarR family winged helix-turn-helix transcriptional regulator [Solirubrobacteraceae bacterium]
MSTDTGPGPLLSPRLGYLFKHVQIRMHELNEEALAPFGIDGRELGILLVIAGHEPGSQQQAAQRLGIDRTSMVARLDALEDKGLVSRHPHAQDRRRNVVELTDAGRDTLRLATKASERAEATLLAPISDQDGERLRDALQAILARPADAGLDS